MTIKAHSTPDIDIILKIRQEMQGFQLNNITTQFKNLVKYTQFKNLVRKKCKKQNGIENDLTFRMWDEVKSLASERFLQLQR